VRCELFKLGEWDLSILFEAFFINSSNIRLNDSILPYYFIMVGKELYILFLHNIFLAHL